MSKEREVIFTFMGDIALNDRYTAHKENGDNPFTEVIPLIRGSDFVVGNLEVVCRGNNGFNPLKHPTLYTTKETLSYLSDLNINLVSLANNHVYDNLESGFVITIQELKKLGVDSLGASIEDDPGSPVIKTIRQHKVGFLAAVHPDTHPGISSDSGVAVSIYNRERIQQNIQRIRKSVDAIILLLHWGVDDSSFPAPWQRRDAKMFINAGVDLIIGHHTHTIQGYEKIKSGLVFYSLGNFCFSPFKVGSKIYDLDQRRHTSSVLLTIKLNENNEMSFKIDGIKNINDKIIPTQKTGKFFTKSRLIPLIGNKVVWPIYYVYLKIFYKFYFYFLGNSRNPVRQLIKLHPKKLFRYLRNI